MLCEVGQVVLRVAAGEALISEEAMKAPYLKACVVSASWRGGCVEVELEVSGRHEFRVARAIRAQDRVSSNVVAPPPADRSKKRARAPNPLSCRKPQKARNPHSEGGGDKKRRKRRRKAKE